MKWVKAVGGALILTLLLVFITQNLNVLNSELVFEFNLIFAKWRSYPLPVGAYLLIAFLLGYFFALVITLGERIKIRRRAKREALGSLTESSQTSPDTEKTLQRKFDG